jgi:hypothetical protein
MKALITIGLALASVTSGAQTTNFNQIQHVETALNHLTVFELGEPIITAVIADHDAFQIQRQDDKVFLMPLQPGISTNLFIWTSTRQLGYEIDAAGDVTRMDFTIRNVPPVQHGQGQSATTAPSDQEIQKIASLVLTQTLLGTRDISREARKPPADCVTVELDQIFRGKDRLYIRYSITNLTKSPFRVTTPDVSQPLPTQQPISMLSLRDLQLSPQTFSAFKATPGSSMPVASAETQQRDLAPGQTTTGVISVHGSENNPPQLYQLNFGADQNHPVTAEAVL